jgi:hypothetical protein
MYHASGRVWVGPGVEETDVDDAVGVAAAVVAAGVGVGVAGVAGCVHPAARTSTAQSTSAEVITNVLFIPDNYMGGVFDNCVFLSGTISRDIPIFSGYVSVTIILAWCRDELKKRNRF